jgi:O-antigen/teichoic acid export membrane protein
MRLESLYWSAIIGFSYQIIHIEIVLKIRKYFKLSSFDITVLKQLLEFSIPLSVGSILFFFLNSYNRLMIESNLGLEVNGYFAIAGKFSLIITFLTSAFTMAWQDYSFAPQDEKERNIRFSNGIEMYYKFLIVSGAIFVFLIAFIFPLLVNQQYKDAYPLIAFSIGVTLFSAIGDFITQTFLALKKTKLILFSSIAVTLLCLLLIPFLLKHYGANGINFGLLIAYFLNVIFRLVYLQVKCDFSVNYFYYIVLLVYFLLACFVFNKQDHIYNGIGLLFSLGLLFWMFRKELQQVFIKIKHIRNR